MKKSIIFSGLQPTGNLNVGNYLGAIKNWVDLQNSDKYEMFIFIADYHSLTGNMAAAERREQIVHTAAELIAAGIDPKKTCLFVQSHVPEHTELAWVLNTITPIAELERMTQFKDKSVKQEKNINAGLLNYPLLMAADVLLYKGTLIPVGQDQIQHVELTRDIARWFNNRYGDFFPEPQHLLTAVPKVMGLLEPTKKMSKSDGPDNVIELGDDPKAVEKKLRRAVTSTEGGVGSPGAENLLTLLKHFDTKDVYKIFLAKESDGSIQYGELKQALATAITEYFADFRARRQELLTSPDTLAHMLIQGAEKARGVAAGTMEEVRKLVGIR